MKKILIADYVYTSQKVMKNQAVLIDGRIVTIAPKSRVLKEHKDAEVIRYPKNSLLFPGLINTHVHIEFSANKTQLSYGDFITWLYSVIENREELMEQCGEACMSEAIDAMLASGITTFGAISSHGMDLKACSEAKQNVIFFNELIGSQAAAADVLFDDFMQRLSLSRQVRREGFIPAVAIHSPYSVHPILVKKALEVVKEQKLPLTAHFMESVAEREWLDSSSGDFKVFFSKLLKQERAVTSSGAFLDMFEGVQTLFAHVVQANDAEYAQIKKQGHAIIHCPISNRLLGNGALDLQKIDSMEIEWMVATDGLSSNYRLDLWEEMKIALFMHSDFPLQKLAKRLIAGVTSSPAKALGLAKGEIKEGYDADMIVLQLDDEPDEDLELHMILHRYEIIDTFIRGEQIQCR